MIKTVIEQESAALAQTANVPVTSGYHGRGYIRYDFKYALEAHELAAVEQKYGHRIIMVFDDRQFYMRK